MLFIILLIINIYSTITSFIYDIFPQYYFNYEMSIIIELVLWNSLNYRKDFINLNSPKYYDNGISLDFEHMKDKISR